MNYLTSLEDHLPLLLVLSPAIGCLLTSLVHRSAGGLVRSLTITQTICSLLLLGGIAWRFETELTTEARARISPATDIPATTDVTAARAAVNRQVDKQRAERLSHQWLVVDGTNLWPLLILIVLTGLVSWQADTVTGSPFGFLAIVQLFEAASLTALMAYDLRVYLIAFGIGVMAMGVLLGQWGGPDRRNATSRFLLTQFCGSSCLMLGFAMLVVAVPWMKIEDAPQPPTLFWNITTIVFEIQKWTTGNSLAFQYENEVFPWMIFILSLGFAIQFGLFPFHSSLIGVLSDAPRSVAVLLLAGLVSASGLGWLRFVVPLAPELLVGFERLILIPALGSAVWGAIRAVNPDEPRRQAAYLFLSLSGVALVGYDTFSRIGMSGGWLMLQQLTVSFILALFVFDAKDAERSSGLLPTTARPESYSTRTLLLLLCLPLLGFFASEFLIFSELFPDRLLVLAGVLFADAVVLLTILSLFNRRLAAAPRGPSTAASSKRFPTSAMVLLALAVIVNLAPNLMLHQCEPEFARVFRRFERVPAVDSAEPDSPERQTLP